MAEETSVEGDLAVRSKMEEFWVASGHRLSFNISCRTTVNFRTSYAITLW